MNLNKTQFIRLIQFFFTIESGVGGHRQAEKTKLTKWLLNKKYHRNHIYDWGVLAKKFHVYSIAEIETYISNHPNYNFLITKSLISFL